MSLHLLDSAVCGSGGEEEAMAWRVTTKNDTYAPQEEESSPGKYLTNQKTDSEEIRQGPPDHVIHTD